MLHISRNEAENYDLPIFTIPILRHMGASEFILGMLNAAGALPMSLNDLIRNRDLFEKCYQIPDADSCQLMPWHGWSLFIRCDDEEAYRISFHTEVPQKLVDPYYTITMLKMPLGRTVDLRSYNRAGVMTYHMDSETNVVVSSEPGLVGTNSIMFKDQSWSTPTEMSVELNEIGIKPVGLATRREEVLLSKVANHREAVCYSLPTPIGMSRIAYKGKYDKWVTMTVDADGLVHEHLYAVDESPSYVAEYRRSVIDGKTVVVEAMQYYHDHSEQYKLDYSGTGRLIRITKTVGDSATTETIYTID